VFGTNARIPKTGKQGVRGIRLKNSDTLGL